LWQVKKAQKAQKSKCSIFLMEADEPPGWLAVFEEQIEGNFQEMRNNFAGIRNTLRVEMLVHLANGNCGHTEPLLQPGAVAEGYHSLLAAPNPTTQLELSRFTIQQCITSAHNRGACSR
jgi:hypothetical protein